MTTRMWAVVGLAGLSPAIVAWALTHFLRWRNRLRGQLAAGDS